MLTSYHNRTTEVVTRREKNRNQVETVNKPALIVDCNKMMRGVDTDDHYVSSYYMFARKSKKWWRKLFFGLLDIPVVNSFLLYNMDLQNKEKTTIESKKFRGMLIL